MAIVIRNNDPLPHLENEGILLKPILLDLEPESLEPVVGRVRHWTEGLTPYQRLFSHHTLCSVRHASFLYRPLVPKDDLDFVLTSTYHHNLEMFPEKVDVVLQPETVGIPTWRKIRNDKTIPAPVIDNRGHPICYGGSKAPVLAPEASGTGKGVGHPITFSGPTRGIGGKAKFVPEGNPSCASVNHQKRSIYSVKLGIGADHIAQTNAGFSRKADGTYYNV